MLRRKYLFRVKFCLCWLNFKEKQWNSVFERWINLSQNNDFVTDVNNRSPHWMMFDILMMKTCLKSPFLYEKKTNFFRKQTRQNLCWLTHWRLKFLNLQYQKFYFLMIEGFGDSEFNFAIQQIWSRIIAD